MIKLYLLSKLWMKFVSYFHHVLVLKSFSGLRLLWYHQWLLLSSFRSEKTLILNAKVAYDILIHWMHIACQVSVVIDINHELKLYNHKCYQELTQRSPSESIPIMSHHIQRQLCLLFPSIRYLLMRYSADLLVSHCYPTHGVVCKIVWCSKVDILGTCLLPLLCKSRLDRYCYPGSLPEESMSSES